MPSENPFLLYSPFQPAGEQPKAIEKHEIPNPPLEGG